MSNRPHLNPRHAAFVRDMPPTPDPDPASPLDRDTRDYLAFLWQLARADDRLDLAATVTVGR